MKTISKTDDITGIVTDRKTGQEIVIYGGQSIVKSIRSLSKFGRITFSREQHFKSTYYTIHFFKPVSRLKTLYNLGNEMLVLGCSDSMRDFKRRTKDFIDYILTTMEEFRNRLDKITCILIDDNEDIVDVVKEDRSENPDARLIVPFSSIELVNGIDEKTLHNRMRDFLYTRDLFGVSSPLHDEAYFFGEERNQTIAELYGKYKQGEHGGLFGLRRIGKTSVLNLLKNRINRDGGIAVYFDCQKYHHSRWNIFLRQIIESVIKTCRENEEYIPKLNKIVTSEQKYSEENASLSFEEDICNLYCALGNTRILLIFDEIESIGYKTSPSKHWGEQLDALYFWEVLRATSQTNNHYFCYIVAGVNPLCMEMPNIQDKPNPIFANFKAIYMNLFSYDDIKKMVSSIGGHVGLEFEEAIYTKLLEDYGGHPFLVRQVCSNINSEMLRQGTARPVQVTKNSYDAHSYEYMTGLSNVIEQILDVLIKNFPKEFELLKTLSINGRANFRKEILDGERSIQHLLGYNLIEKEGDDYLIRIKSVELFMQNKYIFDKELNDQSEIRARLNLRRDKIEEKLRRLIWSNILLKYGRKSKERIIELAQKSIQDQQQQERMNRAVGENVMYELYFSQYQSIINKDWKDYERIFADKTRFDTFFDVLNQLRTVAAHSKPISDEDEAMFVFALNYFEDKLKDLA